MLYAYSLDLGERVLEKCERGLSNKTVEKNIPSVHIGSVPYASSTVKPECTS